MSDQELRELARSWEERRDLEAGRRLVLGRLRAGLLDPERRDLALWLGLDARPAVDPGRRLPERLFQAGAAVPLASVGPGRAARLLASARTADDELQALVVALGGSIGSQETRVLPALLDEVVSLGPRRVVLDLSKLVKIHSYGIGHLVLLANRLADEGGGLAIAAPLNGPVALTIQMLGLAEAPRLCPDVEQALIAPVSGPPPVPTRRRRPVPSDPTLVRWVLRLARWGEAPCRVVATELGWAEQARHLEMHGSWQIERVAALLARVEPERVRAALLPFALS